MATTILSRITVHPMVTMGRIGLLAAYSSELGPGITAITDSTAMSTTATILVTATPDPTRPAASNPSTTSTQTRLGTGKGTWAIPVMMGAANMLLDSRAEGILVAAGILVAEVTARELFQLGSGARFMKRALLAFAAAA